MSAAAGTAGLVLAAGAGERFGGPKAPYVHDGVRLVDRAVRLLTDAGCSPVHVVLGAWGGAVPGAVVVDNPDWAEGMDPRSGAGLESLETTDADRVVITLVDLVGLTVPAVERLAAGESTLAAATYSGRRGHPVVIGRARWPDVAATAQGDRGARGYLEENRADLELVEVGDVADPTDLDHRPDA